MSEVNWPEIFIGVGITLLLAEISGFIPRLAEFIARRLAKQLPELAEEREREWLAILDDVPSPWSKLVRASGWIFVAIREQPYPWITLIDLTLKTIQLAGRPIMLFVFIKASSSIIGNVLFGKYYLIPSSLCLISMSLVFLPKSRLLGLPDFTWLPNWKYPTWLYKLIVSNFLANSILDALLNIGTLGWIAVALLVIVFSLFTYLKKTVRLNSV